MAHLSNMTLELSDKTRVLQAALQLPTFTIEQLADLSGVRGTIVAATISRLKDLIEEVGSLGGGAQRPASRPTRYRLRESARAKVVREAVELAERLRGPPRSSVEDIARGATIALDAVDSSLELGAQSDSAGQNWEARARAQLDLARRLLVLVKDPVHRTPLQRRLVQLASRLEGAGQPLPEEGDQFGPPVVPAPADTPAPQPVRVPLASKGPRTIWKYPNRRLYDALERRYITLNDILQLVVHNVEFVVMEKRGRVDITRAILLQIVAECESAISVDPVLRRDFLAEIIRSCDGAPPGMIVTYLEQSLNAFAAGQKNEPGGEPPR
jgi:polyhydroxyalkanoate synthesis repressor PhaR